MPTSVRFLLAVSASAVLMFTAFGCLLALIFELDGFGRERDTPVQGWYAVTLATGALACVAGAVAAAFLLPKGKRAWIVLPVLVTALAVVALFGMRVV